MSLPTECALAYLKDFPLIFLGTQSPQGFGTAYIRYAPFHLPLIIWFDTKSEIPQINPLFRCILKETQNGNKKIRSVPRTRLNMQLLKDTKIRQLYTYRTTSKT